MLTDYVLIPRAAELTGLTVKAIERKIERGQWLQNDLWVKGPDGHRWISMTAINQWVKSGAKPK